MDGPLRGVNLGGWLVLERWITPSLFAGTDAVDEYSYCQQATETELARLKDFRDTFITKRDFIWLAKQGIEAVRLPVGYWVFGEAPPFTATVGYVDRVFKWAEATGLKVLLDLHAAPGSQNGYDHSGRQGNIGWHKDAANIACSLEVLQRLTLRYARSPTWLGLSLLNEPHVRLPKRQLARFYNRAYDIVRQLGGQRGWVVYSDSYLPLRYRRLLTGRRYQGVYIDAHHYQLFTWLDRWLPIGAQLQRAGWLLPRKLRRTGAHHPLIVGEWSLALQSERLGKLTMAERDDATARYARLQLRAYERSAAWFFWTYKTEAGGNWSFRDCRRLGWL